MRKWWPLVAVCLGQFMLLVQVTIVPVALPAMAEDLRASFSSLPWLIDGYAVALAALLLGAGSLADLVGRRRTYVAGLGLFAAASLVAGIAPNVSVVIAAGVAQGIGAAAMFTTTMAILNLSYQGRDRGTAFGVYGAVSGGAATAGPILGGVLTEHLGWRAVFLVNIPMSVLTIALALGVLTESRNPHARRIDLPGIASFAAATGLITYALIRAGEDGWNASATWVPLAAGAAALAAFIGIEHRSGHAMLDLRLFRSPSFTAIMLAALALSAAAFAYMAYASLWLQSMLDLGAVRAGLALVPMALAVFVTSAATGRLMHRLPPRLTIGGGLLLIGAGALMQAVLDAGSTWRAIVPGLVVAGIGVGLMGPALASAAMAAVPHERGGMAGGALNTFRQLGTAIGVAVLGTIFRTRMQDTLHGHVPDPAATADAVTAGQADAVLAHTPTTTHAGLNHLLHQAFATGLNATYLVAGACGLLTGALALLLVRNPTPPSPAPQPRADHPTFAPTRT